MLVGRQICKTSASPAGSDVGNAGKKCLFEDEDDYEKASPHEIRITSLPPNLAALTPTGRSQCTIREKKYQRRPPLLAKDSALTYPVTYSLPDTTCPHPGPDGKRPG